MLSNSEKLGFSTANRNSTNWTRPAFSCEKNWKERKRPSRSVEERHREAAAQARALKDHELEKARHEVQSLKQRWSEGLNEQREEFLLQLRRKTSDSALSIAGRVLGDLTGDDDLQRVALERFLEKCDELPVEGAVVVRVAAELTEEQKKRLEEKLPAVRYEVDPDLLVGLELVHEGHRIGWSARAHLQAMEEEVDGLIRSEATLS